MKQHNIGLAFGVALGIAAPALAQQAVQWRVEDGGNGHWYQGRLLSSAGISWTNARLAAQQARADLASLDNQALADWIWTNIASRPEFWGPHFGPWVGGFQPSGSPEPAGGWVWVNGQPVGDSIVWSPGQPDNYVPCGGPNDFMAYFKNFQPLPRNEMQDNSNQAVGNCPGGSLGPTTSAIFEWSSDCNGDGVVDYGQILDGTLADINADGLPDACDCNGDGVDDSQQCRNGTLPDYNTNDLPDCCEDGTPCLVGSYPLKWRLDDGGNGHWYSVRLNTVGESWFQCRDRAVQSGGYLATVIAADENNFVFGLASRTPGAFSSNTIQAGPFLGGFQPVGAGEPAGGWTWVTDEAWQFTKWANGQPDNATSCGQAPGDRPGEHYLQFIYASSSWNDMSAAATCFGGSRPSYVVEWSADCNNDGIVDYGQILDGTFPDANGNGVPDCCDGGGSCTPCPGDVASDGMVDGVDLAAVLSQWGTQGSGTFNADIDGSGLVDGGDLALVLGGWGPCPQ